jgi:predicted 3-demethylubiquinone-9 3-methyltransferase (glyoxalase superfamily)
MKTITPFLWFDAQAEEAANFYASVFPNSKIGKISRYGDAGPGPKGSVMTIELNLDGQEEVDHYWNTLSAGGEEGPCGWLKDKYGLSWQVNPRILGEMLNDPNPAKAKAAMEAMLKMKKIVIADLQKAYDAA